MTKDSIPIFSEWWQTQTCIEQDTDYFGNDIGSAGKVDNAESCQLKCQEVENCKYWTWVSSNGDCWLKHKKENVKSKPANKSGPKFCSKLLIAILFIQELIKHFNT